MWKCTSIPKSSHSCEWVDTNSSTLFPEYVPLVTFELVFTQKQVIKILCNVYNSLMYFKNQDNKTTMIKLSTTLRRGLKFFSARLSSLQGLHIGRTVKRSFTQSQVGIIKQVNWNTVLIMPE